MTAAMSDAQIVETLQTQGYIVVPDVLRPEVVSKMRTDLEAAIAIEAARQGGTDYVDYAMVLVCCMYGRSFIDVLADERLMRVVQLVLGEGCIIYAYTSSSMPPGRSNYSNRIHVDTPRMIPGYETNFGAVMLLDDFTEENGATWVLPGSHLRREAPSEEEFFAGARRIVAPAGSVFYLNPRLWHLGGTNQTTSWRHAATLNMCRPYMKQRIDIPKIMRGIDLEGVSEKALQKMGFFAQVPESLEEYYQPPEKRKWRQKTE